MMRYSFAILLLCFAACAGSNDKKDTPVSNVEKNILDSTYQWVKITDSAPWKKSYNFQMFTVHDTAWVFHPDGNWYSVDGKNWIKSPLPNAIDNLAFLDYIYFSDAMYGLGHFEGNIEQFSFKPEIYKSTDLKQWAIISSQSNLPNRFFYHPFVFDHKIWIISGEDKTTKYADIWNSTDAVNWLKQKDTIPMGAKSGAQVVVFKGKLFLLDNDVWSSTDGLNWQQVTPEIAKGERLVGYTPVVYDNRIWLLGCNRNGSFNSQVLVSEDGKNWLGQSAPWSPRGGIAATVFNNKIYITGGKYGGTPDHTEFIYSNDIWALQKK
ncbi:Kelch repeat-containing protein [Ferruginibacter sp.]